MLLAGLVVEQRAPLNRLLRRARRRRAARRRRPAPPPTLSSSRFSADARVAVGVERDRARARPSSIVDRFGAEAALGDRASARCRIAATSSVVRPRSTNTFDRDSSAALTSNDGFSVVAPMRTMSPASTRGRNASCCALLKRWISSMKTIVRRPVARRRRSASAITSRISLMPDSTALNDTNRALRRVGDDARERRLAGAGRAPQDDRLQQVALDRLAQRLARARAAPPGRRTRRTCAAASARRAAPGARGAGGGSRQETGNPWIHGRQESRLRANRSSSCR